MCEETSFGVCREGFDFTGKLEALKSRFRTSWLMYIVFFEESVLTILPAACFILLTPFRILRLVRRRLYSKKGGLYVQKQVGDTLQHQHYKCIASDHTHIRPPLAFTVVCSLRSWCRQPQVPAVGRPPQSRPPYSLCFPP